MTLQRPVTPSETVATYAMTELNLVGPLRLTTPDGRDITPASAKAQGLMALLAASPGMRRPRAWLQDKLWSESPQEQGASSLRQTVLRLRQALGMDADLLVSERAWLGLDGRRVRVLQDPAAVESRSLDEFPEWCEGLDIADPEFEDWIRGQRMDFLDRAEAALEAAATARRAQPTPLGEPVAPQRACLLLAPALAGSDMLRALAEILLADIAAQVANLGAADVLAEHAGGLAPPPPGALRLRVRAAEGPEGAMFRVHIEDAARGALLRNVIRTINLARSSLVESVSYQRFVSEAVHVVTFELGRQRPGRAVDEAAVLGYRAIAHATAFTRASREEGERLLAIAAAVHPAPAILAWRAHFRVVAIFERHVSDPHVALDEATELARHAQEQDPVNPLVLAIASDVTAMLKGRGRDALELARRAVETDPSNAYARISLAYRLAGTPNAARAHLEALRALRLVGGSPNPALWQMIACMTATRCGRYADAVRHGTEAHRLAPEFRPPLRYLAALHYHAGDEPAAAACLVKLKALEPDFSVDLIRNEDYPVATLRDTPLIRLAESKLI